MAASSAYLTDQTKRFLKAVGSSVPKDKVIEITEFAKSADVLDFYKEKPHTPFWYMRLKKEGQEDAPHVGSIADAWVEDEENIQRAAEHVQRPLKPAHRSLVRAFGIYQFKARKDGWMWADPSTDSDPQTLVCVALDNLGLENGFFMDLDSGQDVCIDGNDKILVPPTGGGLAILFWVDI
ncbi:hypothetical protein CB0940_12198 [Cercospora beticola]|uniref:Alpha-ketoglutarate-dependent dioxygenase AlkB-like domain-containing protein n=2 Tax=Cercospora TaxID=29002 RepID=A0A2S6CLK1_9PEZI|nr:hypothetical protein CB0940_12198 [Cercospora beticola]PIA82975.1 hypothetical protein CB0940_12198 [Cercospora beticola]PPJ60593.1 hypothetical protein CBER1_11635 [Cercospora berteroae]WPA97807.1 hypothetical protein RHO25_002418 [Cercospora beticola]